MQQSPWQTDFRTHGGGSVDRKGGGSYDFLERSTSAPPPETGLFFGGVTNQRDGDPTATVDAIDVNSIMLGSSSGFAPDHQAHHNRHNHQQRVLDRRNNAGGYEFGSSTTTPTTNNNNNDFRTNPTDRMFLRTGGGGCDQRRQQRQPPPPPGFSPSFLASTTTAMAIPISSSTTAAEGAGNGGSGDDSSSLMFLGSLDRQTIGDNLVRSRSAAPAFANGMPSISPPPGMMPSRQTPLASNRSTMSGSNGSGDHVGGRGLSGIDSYLEPSLSDRSHILQLGQRRPASTGVIGDHHLSASSSAVLESLGLGSGGGAVRPAAKTLMDLIREDHPPDAPLDVAAAAIAAGDPYTNSMDFHREAGFGLERPRTTSPLSTPSQHSFRDQHHQSLDHSNGNELNSLDQFRLSDGDASYAPHSATGMSREHARPTPSYMPAQQRGGREQGSVRVPIAARPQPSRPRPFRPGQHAPPLHFDQLGAVYAGAQQSQIQTHILPNGEIVYVNAPAPSGYTTIQYHPQSQQHQILQQTFQGGFPQSNGQQQYISVVPMHGNGGHLQTVGPGGSYAYWQPDDRQGGQNQTVSVVSAGKYGVPITATRHVEHQASPEISHRQEQQNRHDGAHPRGGGRGKEKSGKGRRTNGGNCTPRRGGNGYKHENPNNNSEKSHSETHVLDEFKSKKNNRNWTVKDIKGHVVAFSQDQNGSRFLQHRLEVGDAIEKDIVVSEVLPAVDRLRNDVFGNYVVQKLFDFGSTSMKDQLLDAMTGQMVQLSLQMYGCRVVQKALESIDETDLPRLLLEFHNNVLSLIHDQNGNHVIQKCIEVLCQKAKQASMESEDSKAQFFCDQIDFVLDDVLPNVSSLSCHPYGCRVLQRILEHCTDSKKNLILDEVSLCHRLLLDDCYGNYVAQHTLQYGRVEDRNKVLDIVIENGLLKLSRQKFASNVVEKLLKYGNTEQRKLVIREMLQVVDTTNTELLANGSAGTSVVLLLCQDSYANYVVQTTIDVAPESDEKRDLLEELNKHSFELKSYAFAKHIVSRLPQVHDPFK